jgi:DNA-binding MarR family transcriptional regulator
VRSDDIERVSGQVRRFVRRQRAESSGITGLSTSATRVLGAVARAEGTARPSQLATDLVMTSSNVAGALRELSERSLIDRSPAEEDGRRTIVTLTAAGEDLVTAHRATRDHWIAEAIDALLDEHDEAVLLAAGDLLDRLSRFTPAIVPAVR